MRIGINALLLSEGSGYRQTGVSRYIGQLLRELPGAMGSDELWVYAGRKTRPPTHELEMSWKRAQITGERPETRVVWETLTLPAFLKKDKIDLYHGPVNVLPPVVLCPAVMTVHDLAFLRFPEQVTKKRHRYLSTLISSSANKARRIIAVSESTKQDIVELLKVEPEKVAVTPLGVDARFRRLEPGALETFRQQAGIERPFVLFVGTLEPRKNLPRLIDAFALIAGDVPHNLEVIGPEGWLTSEIHRSSEQLIKQGRVKFRGFVPDGQLPAWYSACDLFVFPSLYEGFGLPVLEAMACGAPVVTSNSSSMPELASDAALTVDAGNVESIADAMRKVLTDAQVSRDLGDRGPKRAQSFTWLRTAELTARVYREAVNS